MGWLHLLFIVACCDFDVGPLWDLCHVDKEIFNKIALRDKARNVEM